jgi:hypothetical protein
VQSGAIITNLPCQAVIESDQLAHFLFIFRIFLLVSPHTRLEKFEQQNAQAQHYAVRTLPLPVFTMIGQVKPQS